MSTQQFEPVIFLPDPSKPARFLRDKEGKLYIQFFDKSGNAFIIPATVLILPQELGDLKTQLGTADLLELIRTRIYTSDIMVPVDVQGSAIMVPVDIQGQVADVAVKHNSINKTLLGSSTTALAANASVTLGPADALSYKYINISVFADQAGTLYIDQSPDNTNWDITQSISVSAGVGQAISQEIAARYVRVRYVNGATAQTTFRLYAWLRVL
jgi:hypothetical protein